MALKAGRLRHRIRIEQPGYVQDPATGEMLPGWSTFADAVPAAVEDLSVRDFIAAGAEQSEVTTRITIRYREGVTATMRAIWRGRVYSIKGVMHDPDSGLEYLTLPCAMGARDE